MWNSVTTMLPDEDDVWRMPDVVPDWVLLAEQPWPDLPSCDCGCGLPDEEVTGRAGGRPAQETSVRAVRRRSRSSSRWDALALRSLSG